MSEERERILTGEFKVIFPNVLTPKENDRGDEVYSLTMLFGDAENNAELKRLKNYCIKFAKENMSPDELKKLRSKGLFKMPFKDGNEKDTEKYPYYENAALCEAKSRFRPAIIDKKGRELITEDDFYAGCVARAQVSAYIWSYKNKKGVGLNIDAVLKVSDGEKLGGSAPSANDIFKDFIDSDASENFDESSDGFEDYNEIDDDF